MKSAKNRYVLPSCAKSKKKSTRVPEMTKKMDKEAAKRQRKMPYAFGIGVG